MGVPGSRRERRRRQLRRRRLAALVAVAVLAALAIVAVVSLAGDDPVHGSHGPSGTRVFRYSLHSRLLHRTQHETLITPPRRPGVRPPLLVLLHGRGPDIELGDQLFAALHQQGARAPAVVLPSDDGESYWHDRRTGAWGRYVLDEVIPSAIRRAHADPRRVAIGGISMGGFGALDLARSHPGRFCAVGGHSPALWEQGGDTAAGAFDDAGDFARHDVIAAARADPGLFGRAPVWLDAGTADPFDSGLRALAGVLRDGGHAAQVHRWPGAHEGAYWNAHWDDYLRFYARALAACAA